ncbi:MAG: ATP-binding protein [Flavobacteriales bacterium]|nr:ATP-binding protein [Flavobacteriales bacterium]
MKVHHNPFHLKGYHGPRLFCDREEETKLLIENVNNGVNTTLLSVRRMGKTGLIHHVFNTLNKEKHWTCIYVDIYATQSLAEFTNQLASAILNTFPQSQSIAKNFIDLIKGFSPTISYDPLTGVPEVAFSYTQHKQYEHSLKGLFEFLEQQDKQIVIALDEFQQIAKYPEKNMEAMLRTIIQSLKNVVFVFCGSHKHLLLEMFNSAKRPFFSSTQPLYLSAIPEVKYAKFIKKLFLRNKRNIDEESINFILSWARVHTYYTQALCNKIYAKNTTKIFIEDVYHACDSILKDQENIFFQYRNLLTSGQWNLLRAIAKEDRVYQPTGSVFIGKYQLGNPASVKRSLEALVDKEMVYRESNKEGDYFIVYDCFLSRWLER